MAGGRRRPVHRSSSPSVRWLLFVVKGFSNIGLRRMRSTPSPHARARRPPTREAPPLGQHTGGVDDRPGGLWGMCKSSAHARHTSSECLTNRDALILPRTKSTSNFINPTNSMSCHDSGDGGGRSSTSNLSPPCCQGGFRQIGAVCGETRTYGSEGAGKIARFSRPPDTGIQRSPGCGKLRGGSGEQKRNLPGPIRWQTHLAI